MAKLSAFGNAYNEARMKGRKTFEFKGKLYDSELDKRPQVKKARSEPTARGRGETSSPSQVNKGASLSDRLVGARKASVTSTYNDINERLDATMRKGSSMPEAYNPGGGTKRGNVTTFQPTDEFRREEKRTTGKFTPRKKPQAGER